jgi:ribonuclease III
MAIVSAFAGIALEINYKMFTPLDIVQRNIDYQFSDPEKLKQALTHRSIGKKNNERLEFLGDAILSVTIAQYLFEQFPDACEGQLSRMRANLVRGETLATLAQTLELGNALLLGPGELKSGGHKRLSILADAVEAIIAAIYLDAGLAQAQKKVLQWYEPALSTISLGGIEKDPKSTLQEWLQARQLPLPHYELVETIGKEHQQTFIVRCCVADLKMSANGTSTSRRKAEQDAAKKTLEVLLK